MRARRLKEATLTPIVDRPGGHDRTMIVDGRTLSLTNLDRVLYPATGFTKRDLVAYWLAAADRILPHLGDRPLTVGRFPSGVDGRGFAQTEVPGRPEWVPTTELALVKGPVKRFTLVKERAALVWLAQMGTIELHAFPGLPHDLERTRRVLFDLDPVGSATLIDVAEVALRLREGLRDLALSAKTSGSLGMHVTAELGAPLAVAEARLVAEDASRRFGTASVKIDARQNSPRLTTIVPWSLRSTPAPRVAMPVTWAEIEAAVAARDPSALVFGPEAVTLAGR